MKNSNKIDRPEDRKLQHKIRTKVMRASCTINPPSYITISKGPVAKTKELGDGNVIVDFDKQGNVVGIELLCDATIELK
jgi:hypothetical protein